MLKKLHICDALEIMEKYRRCKNSGKIKQIFGKKNPNSEKL